MKKNLVLVLAMALSSGLMACSNGGKICKAVCTTTDDCGTGMVCDTKGSKECVQCVVDDDCKNSYNRGCNSSTHICRECTADSDCTAGKGCNVDSGICIQCTAASDCGYTGSLGKVCGKAGVCVACNVDEDCAAGNKCDTSHPAHFCHAPCSKVSPCNTGFTCDTGTGECNNCNNDAACKDAHQNSNFTWICE